MSPADLLTMWRVAPPGARSFDPGTVWQASRDDALACREWMGALGSAFRLENDLTIYRAEVHPGDFAAMRVPGTTSTETVQEYAAVAARLDRGYRWLAIEFTDPNGVPESQCFLSLATQTAVVAEDTTNVPR